MPGAAFCSRLCSRSRSCSCFDGHLQVVLPIMAVVNGAVRVRKVPHRPIEYLLRFGHHRGVLFSPRRGHGFQRGDAVARLADIEVQIVQGPANALALLL